jgi:hypothetical protein
MARQEVTLTARDRRFVRVVVALTLGLFAVACCLLTVDEDRYTDGGALHEGPYNGPHPGWGWLDLLFGWLSGHPAWFANPTLVVALLLLRIGWRSSAAAAGILAFSLGLTTCATFEIQQLHMGYYIWQVSLLSFAIGACWACLLERRGRIRCSKPGRT